MDDAHGTPGQKCPRTIAQYCRGRNLRFIDPCWCDHPISPTAAATYTLTPLELTSARGDEIDSKLMTSAPFHNGQPKVVAINAIQNPMLSQLHDRFRKYLADKNNEEPKVLELYHGTNNNILDVCTNTVCNLRQTWSPMTIAVSLVEKACAAAFVTAVVLSVRNATNGINATCMA